MKSLSSKTYQCGVTIEGLTTLAGITYLTGITNTTSWDHVIVGTTAQGQIYTRTYAQFMTDVATGIGLSGYVPTSRTLSINGTTYDLSANRSWTISTVDYTSRLQHQVKAGVAINKGQAVYVTSADGTNMIVGLASNASEATSSKTMGLLDATVTTNGFANVVTEGLLAGLDTSTAGSEGDPVWLGTGGNLIYGLANKPYAPAHLVFIGIVTRKNNSNGEIFVKVQNGFELNEIHDVDLKTTVPVNGHILGFDGTLWVNKTIAGWLGYTPANASGTTNYLSKFTGSTTLGNSLVYDNGTNVGVGTTSPTSKLHVSGGRIEIDNGFNLESRTTNGNALVGLIGMATNAINVGIWEGNYMADLYLKGGNGAIFADFSQGNSKYFAIRGVASATPSEYMRVNHLGNVLIGTSTDGGYRLDVVGNTRIRSNSLTNTVATGGLVLANTTSATSGVTQQNSPSIIFSGSAWVSGALKTHDIAIQSEPQTWDSTRMIWYKRLNNGSWLPFFGLRSDSTAQYSLFLYPVGYLKDGVGQNHSAGFTISNGTQATAVLQQFSPSFMVQGYGWNGTSSVLTSSSWLFAPEAGTTTFQGVSKFIYNESLNNELIRYEFGERLGMWVNKLSLANYVTTINSYTTITGSVTAASAIARGTYLNQTLVAAANNDTLIGLDINPTFNAGSFTGVQFENLVIRGGTSPLIRFKSTVGTNLGQIVATPSQLSINAQANTISLVAGNTEAVNIFSGTRNVLIQNGGTFTDAGYRLDVAGNTRVNGGNTSADITFIINNRFQFKGDGVLLYGNAAGHGRLTWDGSGAYFSGLSGYGVGLGANGSLNHLFINTSGNVGIGTSTPDYKLHVVNSEAAHVAIFVGNSRAYGVGQGTWGSALHLGKEESGTNQAMGSIIGAPLTETSSTEGYLSFGTRTGGAVTTRMYIANTGNVGIGTTNPAYKLQVEGSVYFNGSTNNFYVDGFSRFGGTNSYATVINNAGDLGLGITPTAKLQVAGLSILTNSAGNNYNENIRLPESSAGWASIVMGGAIATGGTGATVWSILKNPSGSGHRFSIMNNTSEYFTIFTSGNVSIGSTTDNGNKLNVAGTTRLGGNTVVNGSTEDASNTATLTVTTTNTSLRLGGNTTYSWIQTHSAKPLYINELGNNIVLNLLGGSVGIGTASPSTKLDVNGVITATGGNSTQWNTAYSWGNHSSAGYVPQARTLTINGTTYDLSANRSWTIATTTPGGSNTQFQYNSSGTLAGASALTYDSTTNRVGINQASPGYDLDVNGQVRVQDKLRVGNVNSGNGVVHMSSTATINPSATTIVWSQNVSVGMCAFIEYYILNNNTTTDQRAGTIMVTWNQSGTPTISHTETTTPDIGSTTPVTFTSSLVGSDARINAVNSSSAPYTIVMSYKYF